MRAITHGWPDTVEDEVMKAREEMMPTTRTAAVLTALWRVLAALYLLALAWIVLTPADVAGQATGIVTVLARALEGAGVPFGVGYPVLEFTANIALFVPFGALAVVAVPLRAPSRASTLAVIASGALASIAIELTQLLVPGRVSALSDVIANTLGTGVGVAFGWWMLRLSRRRRQDRARGSDAAASDPRAIPGVQRSGSQLPSA